MDWRHRLSWPRALRGWSITGAPGRAPAEAGLAAAVPPLPEIESSGGQLLQQLTRYRTASGSDVVRGTLLAEFAPGQREATLCVAFCPPFERLPDVEARAAEEFAAVKLAQRLHNGAQFDVRLAEPAEDRLAISVEFSAVEPPPSA